MSTLTGSVPNGTHSLDCPMRQRAIAINKWQALRAVEEARQSLKLKGTTISVLRAIISFIKDNEISMDKDVKHICFASNVALANRVHVSVQTIERHVAKLVALGILTRRSSGNGKRWARRSRSGEIVLATGLSLAPLIERHAEFTNLARRHADERSKLIVLRDKCLIALANLKSLISDLSTIASLLVKSRNILRRRLDNGQLSQLLSEIEIETSRASDAQAINLRDSDHTNEGHKEPNLNQKFKGEEPSGTISTDQLENSFPELCKELRQASTQSECSEKMESIAQYLGLSQAWKTAKHMGVTASFVILGYILQRSDRIRYPKAYALKLLSDLNSGTTTLEDLIDCRTSPIGQVYNE